MQPTASPQVEQNPIATPYPVVPGATLPWWLTSKTFYGLLTLVVAFLLSKATGATVTADDAQVLDLATNVIEILGAGLVLIGRVHAQMRLRESEVRGQESEVRGQHWLPGEELGFDGKPRATPDANGQARDFGVQPEAFRNGGPIAPLILLFAALALGGCASAIRNPQSAIPPMVFEEHGWERNPRLSEGVREGMSETLRPSVPPSLRPPRPAFRATAPKLRDPSDVPDSWRRTLHHRDESGAPVIIIPTAIPAEALANFAAR